ncbi:MAG: IS1/IS1595 family N-terminal zinc-binding domain-containing protein, partial [Terriglobia bacterium]
ARMARPDAIVGLSAGIVKESSMTCIRCKHENVKRFGKYGRHKIQRYRCRSCKASFSDTRSRRFESHYLSVERTAQVVSLMVESVSLRAMSRLTGVDRNTVLSIVLTVGAKCHSLLDTGVRHVRAHYLQLDETWSFVHKKEKRVRPGEPASWGDAYTWIGLDRETIGETPPRLASGRRMTMHGRMRQGRVKRLRSTVKFLGAERGGSKCGRTTPIDSEPTKRYYAPVTRKSRK